MLQSAAFRVTCLSFATLVLAVACNSPHEGAAPAPSVAARHAPSLALAAAPDTNTPRTSATQVDAAQAFDPPARLRLPSTLRPGERVPFLLVLHGFGVSSTLLIVKADLNQVADQKRFAYLAPEGARDSLGRPFWNAGTSCCDLEHQQIDDVKRLRELLDANLSDPSIDPQRVFLVGYSNGGFMAQRLACDRGDRIAGVISVAGAAPSPEVSCAQHTAFAFLEIHGDADPVVHYAGGTVFDRPDMPRHASAPDTASFWAQQLSCTGAALEQSPLDIEPQVPDRETSVQRYEGCRGSVELWTVRGGGHYVALQPPAIEAMWTFMQAHPKSGS